MSNRSNINIRLPQPSQSDPNYEYLGRLVRTVEQALYIMTSIREHRFSTLTVQDMASSGYNLPLGELWYDDLGYVRISLANVAALSGAPMSASIGTVTVSTS